jgi:C4-dicarboxylate-specific signal transduction histidine kinase
MNLAPFVLLVAAAVAAVVGLGVVVLVVRSGRRRLQAQLDAARADMEALSSRVDQLSAEQEQPSAGPVDDRPAEFVITSIGDRPNPAGMGAAGRDVAVPEPVPAHLTAGEFASVALGESLVRMLSLGYGVRRALSAENRNRIRFEMRREVRRSRKQRRRDLRTAARTLRAHGGRAEDDAA